MECDRRDDSRKNWETMSREVHNTYLDIYFYLSISISIYTYRDRERCIVRE